MQEQIEANYYDTLDDVTIDSETNMIQPEDADGPTEEQMKQAESIMSKGVMKV